MRNGLFLIAILALIGCAAPSSNPNSKNLVVSEGVQEIAEANPDGAVTEDDERVQCKREQKLGSHRYTKVCMTVAEWRERREATQRAMEGNSRRGACVGCGAGENQR